MTNDNTTTKKKPAPRVQDEKGTTVFQLRACAVCGRTSAMDHSFQEMQRWAFSGACGPCQKQVMVPAEDSESELVTTD